MIVKSYSFEKNGKLGDVYTLRNQNGMEADILTYGGRLIRLTAPDRCGNFLDCIVGCKHPEDYYEENPYFGAIIGRYANRIGGGKFTLDGKVYQLEQNEGKNSHHGGVSANFDRVVWNATIEGDRLARSHLSKNGAGGYPGNLEVKVAYTLTDGNELVIEYLATSDKDTPCNLTHHAYFNLSGKDTVLEHELKINARKITPIGEDLVASGEYMEIDGTPYSFLPAKKLGKDMFSDAELIQRCGGFDFNYCLDRVGKGVECCARVYDEHSGRYMECYTTLPGLQLYTGNFLEGFEGKKKYGKHAALCLEAQGYPNSVNCPAYPSTILKAGETYHEITAYKFGVK